MKIEIPKDGKGLVDNLTNSNIWKVEFLFRFPQASKLFETATLYLKGPSATKTWKCKIAFTMKTDQKNPVFFSEISATLYVMSFFFIPRNLVKAIQ